jgi:hypothetical protein
MNTNKSQKKELIKSSFLNIKNQVLILPDDNVLKMAIRIRIINIIIHDKAND